MDEAEGFELNVMEERPPTLRATIQVKPLEEKLIRLEVKTAPNQLTFVITSAPVGFADLTVDQARSVGSALLNAAQQVAAREDA